MAEFVASKVAVTFTVNGIERTVETYPMARLLDVLREELRLTGTKEGCGEGECGACSAFVDGRLVNTCLVPVLQLQGAKVETIEGLATGAELHAVQQAFIDAGGAQCGICTPGMVLATVALLRDHPEFQPAGANVNFVQTLGPASLKVRTYERGVENETMACGTGAVAAALVSALLGQAVSPVAVTTSGGDRLLVHFRLIPEDTPTVTEVFLEGPAHFVYEGQLGKESLP